MRIVRDDIQFRTGLSLVKVDERRKTHLSKWLHEIGKKNCAVFKNTFCDPRMSCDGMLSLPIIACAILDSLLIKTEANIMKLS